VRGGEYRSDVSEQSKIANLYTLMEINAVSPRATWMHLVIIPAAAERESHMLRDLTVGHRRRARF
jgi:hypothetical protein